MCGNRRMWEGGGHLMRLLVSARVSAGNGCTSARTTAITPLRLQLRWHLVAAEPDRTVTKHAG